MDGGLDVARHAAAAEARSAGGRACGILVARWSRVAGRVGEEGGERAERRRPGPSRAGAFRRAVAYGASQVSKASVSSSGVTTVSSSFE
jgi:hypothetical protein